MGHHACFCTKWMTVIATLQPTRLSKKGTRNSKKNIYWINFINREVKQDRPWTNIFKYVSQTGVTILLYYKFKNSLYAHIPSTTWRRVLYSIKIKILLLTEF